MNGFSVALLMAASLARGAQTPSQIANVAFRYETGGGLEVQQIEILQSGEFTFEYENDVDAPLIVHGVARIENDLIRLYPNESLSGSAFWNTPRRLVPVALGDRLYLVRPEDRDYFCADVRENTEPRATDLWGQWLLRVDDWKKEPGKSGKVPFCSQ